MDFRKFGVRFYLLLASNMLIFNLMAQPDLVFYHNSNLFSSSNYNPAFLSKQSNFSFSIFPLGGTGFGYNHRSLIDGSISQFMNEGVGEEEYPDIIDALTNRLLINQNIESSLLNIVYPSSSGNFNFRIREKAFFSVVLNGDLIKSDLDGESIQYGNGQKQEMPAQTSHYREYSLAFAPDLKSIQWSYGARIKLLFGKSAFYSDLSGMVEKTNGKDIFKPEGELSISYPSIKPKSDPDFKQGDKTIPGYLFNNGNVGLGLDFGLSYQINSKLFLSLSALDIGFINWRTHLHSKHVESWELVDIVEKEGNMSVTRLAKKPREWDKVSMEANAVIVPGYIHFIDSFKTNLSTLIDQKAFLKALPVTLLAGLNYRLNPKVSLGFAYRIIYIPHLTHHSASISANVSLNKQLHLVSGYSIIGNSYLNLPLGFQFDWKQGQAYLGTDNMISIFWPSTKGLAGLSFGACFYIFTHKPKFKNPDPEQPFHRRKKDKPLGRRGLIYDNFLE